MSARLSRRRPCPGIGRGIFIGLGILLTAWLLSHAGCDRTPRQDRAEIALAQWLEAASWRSFEVIAESGGRAIRIPQGEAIRFTARGDHRSELSYLVDDSVPGDALALTIEWGGATPESPRPERRELSAVSERGGLWRVALSGGSASEAAETRLPFLVEVRNRSSRDLLWRDPRLVVPIDDREPTLGAELRPPNGPINVILYVIDTARRDRMSLYGYLRDTTPQLSRLAQRATVFEAAYAAGPATTPSVSALFASRLPAELGGRLVSRDQTPLTMAESFERAGYATAGFQTNFLLTEAFGYGRGFERYEVLIDRSHGVPRAMNAEELHAAALSWLEKQRERPFFLYLQSMDVHDYAAPEEWRRQFEQRDLAPAPLESIDSSKIPQELREQLRDASDQYDTALAYTDHEIARFLRAVDDLGLADRTLVIITADHGEALGQRGQLTHGANLYDELVRVPMLLYAPWSPNPRRLEDVVSLLDIAPTLTDLAGIPGSSSFLGRSLLAPLPPGEIQMAVGSLMGAAWKGQKVMRKAWYLREGDYKLIMDLEGAQLFHLPSDPLEQRDLSAAQPVTFRYLREKLMWLSPSFRPEWREARILEADLSPEDRADFEERLRALGYVE